MQRRLSLPRIVAVLGIILSLGLSTASQAKVVTEWVEYEHDGVALKGYLAYDDAYDQPQPGVLVIHQWWGLGEYEKLRAEQLAQMGYVAFAVDMYGADKYTDDPAQAAEWATPMYQDRELGRARAAAALEVLSSRLEVDPSQLASIGYCFGGTISIELAFSGADLDVVVSFHGSPLLPSPEDAKQTRGEIVLHHGYDDPLYTLEQYRAFVDELASHDIMFTSMEYAKAVHSFTVPESGRHGIEGVEYQQRADEQSWEHLKFLLEQVWK